MEYHLATDNLARLKEPLEDLLQFGSADLDFGIYRIMFQKERSPMFGQRPSTHSNLRGSCCDTLPKQRQLAQLVLHRPQEDTLGSCSLVGCKLLRTFSGGTN
jgi:hypothetical protein